MSENCQTDVETSVNTCLYAGPLPPVLILADFFILAMQISERQLSLLKKKKTKQHNTTMSATKVITRFIYLLFFCSVYFATIKL